jgi:hypothetical protein
MAQLGKIHIDYVTVQHDGYPNDRISSFSLINNWQYEYERPVYSSKLNGALLDQEGTKSTRGITCWGCGREGITLAQ